MIAPSQSQVRNVLFPPVVNAVMKSALWAGVWVSSTASGMCELLGSTPSTAEEGMEETEP